MKTLAMTTLPALRMLVKLVLGRGRRLAYGQFGEDAIVQTILNSNAGTYVDVGAFDPVLYSNTYALYRRGWHGIAIDPNPTLAIKYRIFRPRDSFVCAAIGAAAEGTYYSFVDAAYNTFDAIAAERWQRERGQRLLSKAAIPFKSLATIIAEKRINVIDYLNVDVEGFDLMVLQSHDWTIRPRVISIEEDGFDPDQPHSSGVYAFLREKGYALVGFSRQTLVFREEARASA